MDVRKAKCEALLAAISALSRELSKVPLSPERITAISGAIGVLHQTAPYADSWTDDRKPQSV